MARADLPVYFATQFAQITIGTVTRSCVVVPCDLSRFRRRVRIVAWERPDAGTWSSCTRDLRSWRYRCTAFRSLPVPSDSREHAAFLGLGTIVPVAVRASRRSEPVIELADPANSRLSFSNLTEAHVLDALRRQYQVELPQIRRAVNYLREHFRTQHPWFITRCSRTASTCSLKPRDLRM